MTKIEKGEKREKQKKKQAEKDSTEIQKKTPHKWSVIAIAGPVIYKMSEKTSILDPSLDGAETTGEINFAYGLGVGFNLNEKLSLRYSAIRTKLGYSVNNVRSTGSLGGLRIFSMSAISGHSVSQQTMSSFAGNDNITLLQEIEYIEMPLQLTYSLSQSRFGAHVFGGFSTFFVTHDRIFAKNSSNEELDLGRSRNLSKLN